MTDRFTLGSLELMIFSDVTFWLDGGTMFGTLPRVIWEQTVRSDKLNRVPLASRSLFIRGQDKQGRKALVLVDTGLGDLANNERFRDLYGVTDPAWRLLQELSEAGISPDEITHVVLTHLHFDHVGGAVRKYPDGPRLTFENAQYIVNKGELDYARAPDRRSRASYRPETWEPLIALGALDTVEGEIEVIPGVRLCDAPGHTDYHQVVVVSGGKRTVLFTADLFPFAMHLKSHYVPAIDLDPRRTIITRDRYLQLINRKQWLLLFQHDPIYQLVRIGGDMMITPATLF